MARKKVVTTEEIELPTANERVIEDEPLTPDQLAEFDAVEYLLSLGGDDGVRYRVDKLPSRERPGERPAFCMNYNRDSLSLDTIRDTFGGGSYQITAYAAGSKYAGQKRVTIAELPKSMQTPAAGPSVDLAAVLQAAKGDNSSNAIMLQLIKSQSDMLTAILARPPPATAPAPTIMEMLAMMREMNRDTPKTGEDGAVKLLLQGIELGKEFAGGAGGDDSLLGVASKGIDMLKPLIEREAQNPRPAQVGQVTPRLAAPAPGAAAPSPENDPMLRQLNWLRQQTVVLCHHAARGKSPELYAEVLLDNLPDFLTADELLARLKEPNAIVQLAQINADVSKYAPWFEELRKAIIEFLKPDDMQEFAPGQGGHEADDPAGGES